MKVHSLSALLTLIVLISRISLSASVVFKSINEKAQLHFINQPTAFFPGQALNDVLFLGQNYGFSLDVFVSSGNQYNESAKYNFITLSETNLPWHDPELYNGRIPAIYFIDGVLDFQFWFDNRKETNFNVTGFVLDRYNRIKVVVKDNNIHVTIIDVNDLKLLQNVTVSFPEENPRSKEHITFYLSSPFYQSPNLGYFKNLFICIDIEACLNETVFDHMRNSFEPPNIKNYTVAYITASFGGYEKTPKRFAKQTIHSDFIYFTNSHVTENNGWIIDPKPYHDTNPSPLDDGKMINSFINNRNPMNLAKYYKEAFHNIPRLKDYDIVIWIDGSMEINNPSVSEFVVRKIVFGDQKMVIWRHSHADSIISESRSGSRSWKYTRLEFNGVAQPFQNIIHQRNVYIANGYSHDWWTHVKGRVNGTSHPYGHWITCFIAFDMKDGWTRTFLDQWFYENLKYSTEDQVSFPYVVQKLGFVPYTLPDADVHGTPEEKTDHFIHHTHADVDQIDLWVSLSCRLDEIDPVEETFTVNGWLNLFWIDEDLPKKQSIEKGFTIVDDNTNIPINTKSLFENAVKEEILVGPLYYYCPVQHNIHMAIRFNATFSEAYELEKFPYDRQYLTMRFCIRTKQFNILSEPPAYAPNTLHQRVLASYTTSPSVSNWIPSSPVVSTCKSSQQCGESRLAISLRVERQPYFYMWNITFPIYMIGCCAPVAFALPPTEIGERMAITLALLLTLVTFKFVVSAEIPKTSVITFMDMYVLGSYMFIMTVVVQTLVCLFVIDKEFHVLCDYASGILYMVYWTGLHVWIIHGTINKCFCIPWEDMKDEDSEGQPAILVQGRDIEKFTEMLKKRSLAKGSRKMSCIINGDVNIVDDDDDSIEHSELISDTSKWPITKYTY